MRHDLAHELGHGVHQVLAAGQGELLSSTRRPLKCRIYRQLPQIQLEQATTQEERKVLLGWQS
jgi:oligoendopeptidase F